MQNLQDVSENIFVDIKNILSELSACDTPEQFLAQEDLINNMYQRFSYLKIAKEKGLLPSAEISAYDIDNQEVNINSDIVEVHQYDEADKLAEIIVEDTVSEDIFANVKEVEEVSSFSEIDEQEAIPTVENEAVTPDSQDFSDNDSDPDQMEIISATETAQDNPLEHGSEKLEPMQDSQFSFAMEKDEPVHEVITKDYETSIAEKEQKLRELEENRKKAMSQSAEHSEEKPAKEDSSLSETEDQQEKKFRLAHIKGLKIAKSLFDDELFDSEEKPKAEPQSGSLLKNNVPTDYMEAPKPRPEFKLDLNDRIAFSQHLFDGSQSELNEVVNRLNAFTSVADAQEFLSDIYYAKDWKKVDNYAQRLWTLVENRFL